MRWLFQALLLMLPHPLRIILHMNLLRLSRQSLRLHPLRDVRRSLLGPNLVSLCPLSSLGGLFIYFPHSDSKPDRDSSKQVNRGRNKFDPVVSPILPSPLSAWVRASKEVGANFNDSQAPRSGVPRGYVLPDPEMLGGMDAKLYQPFLKMYLRLRPVLHYRLRKVGISVAAKSNAEWRKLLGLDTFKQTEGSKASQDRAQLLREFEHSLKGSGMVR